MDRLTSINVSRVGQNLSSVLFNKSLVSMVKGMRSARDSGGAHAELQYINKCIIEINDELQSSHADIKSTALQKMIYLHMHGYDMSRYAFNIVEVMSSQWFGYKKIAYLSAALIFSSQTDVILLTTHTFRKSFTGSSVNTSSTMQGTYMPATSSPMSFSDGIQYEIGSAIGCFASVVTRDLAVDLLADLYALLHSTRPYIRKRATLALLNVFNVYPESLTDDTKYIDHIVKSLSDDHSGVVSASVYVICELAHKQPDKYLYLTPLFFNILTTSSNNWVLIKVVKLLGSLVPYEPRLLKKLIEPLSDIISTTPAKSLLYECVNTMLSGDLTNKTAVMLCLDKLKLFITDPDQNLKYLGLLGLHKLMLKYPKLVGEHKDLVLDCLSDDDITIRMRALDLITSMVTQRNVQSIVNRMITLLQASDLGHYRSHVLNRMIDICSNNNYEYIVDFEWYISTLIQLTHLQSIDRTNTSKINQQLLDVVVRVPDVRRFAVQQMTSLLLSHRLSDAASNTMCEVLYSAGFVVGEYSQYVTQRSELVELMMQPSNMSLPAVVQQIYMQAAFKLMVAAMQGNAVVDATATADLLQIEAIASEKTQLESTSDEQKHTDKSETAVVVHAGDSTSRKYITTQLCGTLIEGYKLFSRSNYPEVQERAVSYQHFTDWILCMLTDDHAPANNIISLDPLAGDSGGAGEQKADMDNSNRFALIASQLSQMFAEPLNPVNVKAQRKVPPPKDIDLAQPFNASWNDTDTEEVDDDNDNNDTQQHSDSDTVVKRKISPANHHKLSKEERKQLRRESRLANEQRRKADPFYLKQKNDQHSDNDSADDADIPIQSLSGADLPAIQSTYTAHKPRKRHDDIILFDSDEDTLEPARKQNIVMVEDMPSDAAISDNDQQASTQHRRKQRLTMTDDNRDRSSKRKPKSKSQRKAEAAPEPAAAPQQILSLDLFDPLNNSTQPQSVVDQQPSAHKPSIDSAASQAVSVSSSGQHSQAVPRSLYRDSSCRINYTLTLEGNTLQLQLHTATRSSKTLNGVEYSVELQSSNSLRLTSSDTVDAQPSNVATITYSANVDIKQLKYFKVAFTKSVAKQFKLRCTIHRNDANNHDNNKSKTVDIKVPLSIFVHPVDITANELSNQLTEAGDAVFSAVQKCTVLADHVHGVIEQIQVHSNLAVVEGSASTSNGMLYGQWAEPARYKDFIAVMLKLKGDTLQISVKTTNQEAADSVLAELVDSVK